VNKLTGECVNGWIAESEMVGEWVDVFKSDQVSEAVGNLVSL
jgi:hypothetical protein